MPAKAFALLLLVAPSAAGAAPPAPAEVADALYAAHADVENALLSANLLMTSSQASLMRLRWTLGEWGLPKPKAAAARRFTRLSELMSAFRAEAEAEESTSNPLAPYQEKLAASPEVAKAAAGVPGNPGAQVEEAKQLRAQYDAEASRAALTRSRGALARLSGTLGQPRITVSQALVLRRGSEIQRELSGARDELAKALPPPAADKARAKRSREKAGRDLADLAADASGLATELERLRIHFQLNNYHGK